jgi:hypothetical protein
MGMIFKNIEYMNGGVLKISAVRLYPKVLEEVPPGVHRSSYQIDVDRQFWVELVNNSSVVNKNIDTT